VVLFFKTSKSNTSVSQWEKSLHAGKITAMDTAIAKAELRKRHTVARPLSSAGLTEQLKNLVETLGPKVVASYVPLKSEPDTGDFNQGGEARFKIVFPRVVGTELEFASGDFSGSGLGISEPDGEAIALSDIDVFLVPALAVDISGNRLGKGKGFYDRCLKKVSNATVIAVVFDQEVLEKVPSEEFDQRVDGIVTPSRWWLI